MPPQLDKVKEILNMVNDGLTKDDFIKAFDAVMATVARVEKICMDKIEARLALIKDGINGKDGRDGIDGQSVTGPQGPKGEKGDKGEKGESGFSIKGNDGSPDTSIEVRDKLETLIGQDRLDASAIKGLEELEKKVDEKTGNTVRIGWGAHPVMIQGLGVVIDKNTRVINFTGAGLTSVTRSPSGVVTVAIGGGGSSGTAVSEEAPTDSGNHINFTLAHTPLAGTFQLFRGGAKQAAIGTSPDYSRTGTALTLTNALDVADGEVLLCAYSY